MRTWELIAKAEATELETCVVGLAVRSGKLEKVVVKPLACYFLYKGYLVDPYGTTIPPHRVRCVKCERVELGKCPPYERPPCETLIDDWAKLVVCDCDGVRSVRGPRGCAPVAALRGPPYPLVCNDQVIGCVGDGECEGELKKVGVWYWYS